jgi:hypothetical protein
MREVQTRIQLAFFPCYLPNLVRAILARPRLVMWLEIAFIAYVLMFVAAPPALAAPPNPLEALDRADGNGYSISNYNIEFLLDLLSTKYPMQSMTAGIVGFLWDACRYGVGAVALLIDLTLGFGWLTYLIYPIEQTAEVLDGVLDQLPMVRELLIFLACVVGIVRMYVGQQARGLTDMFGSFVLWGISAAIVTNPVAWLTGPTGLLTRTQEAAQQFSAQLVNPDAAIGEVEASEASGTMGQQIVSIFVRAPHQFIAYGGLADGGGCEATYNENLTKSGEDLANAMLACSPDFGATIKNPSSVTLVTTLIILVGIAVLLTIAVVCSMIIIYEVANMLIAGVHGGVGAVPWCRPRRFLPGVPRDRDQPARVVPRADGRRADQRALPRHGPVLLHRVGGEHDRSLPHRRPRPDRRDRGDLPAAQEAAQGPGPDARARPGTVEERARAQAAQRPASRRRRPSCGSSIPRRQQARAGGWSAGIPCQARCRRTGAECRERRHRPRPRRDSACHTSGVHGRTVGQRDAPPRRDPRQEQPQAAPRHRAPVGRGEVAEEGGPPGRASRAAGGAPPAGQVLDLERRHPGRGAACR